MINLVLAVAPADISLRPGAPPAQAPASERGAAQNAEEDHLLGPGKPVERELSAGRSHFYKISLTSGQYLQVTVSQQGIDALVALFTPDGRKIGEVDGEQATVGAETISAIAEAPGAYRIEVRSAEKTVQTGRYEINVGELREATAEDKYRVAAEALFYEAGQLRKGTLEAKRKGVEKYHEALELYRKAGDRSKEALTLNSIGAVHWSLGEMQKALEKYNEALPITRAVGDRRGEALTLNNIGVVYWSLGEIQKALEKYDEALPIRRAAGDRIGEAATLNNIGVIYASLGENQKALERLNEVLSIRRAIGDRGGEAQTLNNISRVYWSLGEMQKALEAHNEALPIRRAVGDRRGEALTLNNIGAVFWSLGEIQKALEKYNEALPIRRAIGDRIGESQTLSNIGMVYWSLGETQKALEAHNEALSIRRAVGDRNGEAQILNYIGTDYRSLGEMLKALEKYNEALPIMQAVSDRNGEAATLGNIGIVYSSLGEIQKALEKYNEALPIRRAVGDRSGEAEILLEIARAEQKLGNLAQARQSIEQAVGIIELMRINVTAQELRTSFFASRREFYETYIEVLMQMRKQNPTASFDAMALAVSERARARSLLELLTEAHADIRQGVDGSLLDLERSLRQRLAARAAAQADLLNRKHTPEQAEVAAKEISSITAEYDDLEARIRASSPRYSALTQPQPLNLTEIQHQILDPDTLLLEYSLGDDASYLFVVSQKSITSHQLPKRAEIEAATRRVRELLTAPQPQPGDTEAKYQARVKEAGESYWARAAELSRMLLGPVASQLGKKRLAIVADGALQYIPFAALPAPSPGNGEGRDSRAEPQPLFVEHEIVSLPSASTLATLRRETAGRKPAEKSLAVLADPVFTDDDTRVRRNASNVIAQVKARSADSDERDIGFLQMTRSGRETGVIGAEAGFGRLLSTRREAAAILALVPERERMQALDFEASRTAAMRPELGEYRIIHFATHGMLNNIHPELSGIVLSLVDKAGHQQ
ncbi:MAG TPA: tetratricopeptide repeat protein, partial [Blastocatellia bacterium]|nr:tetratricopeptide repeat protein [Blastocatellia bacterium]